MILSKKTRCAILALTRLASEYRKGPMQILEIAEEEKFCKDETTCQIRKVFKEIRDTTYGILTKTMLEELIKR